MKVVAVLFTQIFLLFILIKPAYSQDCQQCKSRILLMYDNKVLAQPDGTTATAITNYWKLFFIAGGIKNYIVMSDPSKDCIEHIDGAFFTSHDTIQQSSIKFGTAHANTPPAERCNLLLQII
jgi:hypothetical protein